MTQVQIAIEDVLGRSPSRGDRLWVRAAGTRSGSGGQVIAPVAVPVEVHDDPTIEMEPGPARVRFELRDLAVDQTREFPVTVPAEGPVTLRDILDESYDWTPDELSAFALLRAEAVDAAGRAESAAGAADADRVQSGLDRVATSEDRTQTGLDRTQTGLDRVATGQDRTATGEDRTQTGLDREQARLDRVATGQDRTQTGLDRVAAAESASAAETAANEFGLTVTSSQVGPEVPSSATLSGDGPAYAIHLGLSKGRPGDKGDPGEVTTAALNSALAGKADLTGGQVPTSQLPAIALTKPFPVADRAAMLALTAEEGDVAVVTAGADKGTYMLSSGPSGTFSSWVKLTTPDAPVQSVNGQTGTVNLNAANVGARPSSYVPAWSEVTSKPTTFPPTIGTTASTAKPGNYVPAWSEVTGKPAAFPPATHSHTADEVGAVTRQGAATGLWIGTTSSLPATGTAGVLYVTTE